jgi:hypothetical protein
MFLITRPNHDNATNYLSYWSEQLIQFAKEKGKTVIDLQGSKANKDNLEKVLRKKDVHLILFNGHGDYDLVTGHKNEPLIKSSINANVLKDKIVVCRSCKSGKHLGPSCIISGTIAFIGYKDDFLFFYDPNNITRPLNDRYAKRFLESDNTCIISLLKGNTVLKAFESSQYQYKKHIQEILTHSNDPAETTHSLPALFWNLINHTWEGESSATY